jgi:hypothetical protein
VDSYTLGAAVLESNGEAATSFELGDDWHDIMWQPGVEGDGELALGEAGLRWRAAGRFESV